MMTCGKLFFINLLKLLNSTLRSTNFSNIELFQCEPPFHDSKTPFEGLDPLQKIIDLHQLQQPLV